jgi:hypothetical protein
MNESYKLGKSKTLFETAEFPTIAADEKVGIIFDGDIESKLLVIIAAKLYGIDRVVFINDKLMSYDGKLFPARKNQHRLEVVKSTFEQSFKQLGGMHRLDVATEIFVANRDATNTFVKLLAKKYNGKLKFVLSGWNKIHEQSILMLKNCGWDRGKITKGHLLPWLEKNADLYPELHKYVFEQSGNIFGVNKNVGFEQCEIDFNLYVRPFRNLTTSDVIELYKQLDCVSLLYDSSSCDDDLGNCGLCGNCLRRKSAFKNSSVVDLTKYTFK